MTGTGQTDEATHDRARRTGQARGDGMPRRRMLRLAAGGGLALTAFGTFPAGTASAAAPIVKPLPPEIFEVYGTNAETRWEALSGQGYLTPVDRFFVRNHTSTPLIDAVSWRLKLFGTGLRGAPTADRPVEFTYADLLRLPSETITCAIECAGNGRSFFTGQQGQAVSGTPWKLGAIGVARWRGVRLATVLAKAGLTRHAVDVLPEGLDADYVTGGVNLGKVRRPLPVAKALQDVLLAYEMNGQPLPPDHGHPVRLVVPSWAGISSIKWLGRVEVSETPLLSPWNTQYYRLLGPDYPAEGTVVTRQAVKSAFELPWNAEFGVGDRQVLRGRSWSGNGRIRRVEVDTGKGWRQARFVGAAADRGWQGWEIPWRPRVSGAHTLRARAADISGVTQPDVTPHNTQGYLFDAVVRHPVRVV
ncbi:sulfite oxidase [Amycolatopsis orientalis]|uniref:sulfite oxidase n=1 Tax=Amycolatopsis orientalis TaxID=31958 RepID=UPI00055C196E|nr:sulfite oxidase [Amycolatopsis orientalis]